MKKFNIIWIIALILLVLPIFTTAFTGESPNYNLNRSSFGYIGHNATSPNYASHTHGNTLATGNATSPSYSNEIGYIHTLLQTVATAANSPVIQFIYSLPRNIDYNDTFILRANVTDADNDLLSVNFSLKDPADSYTYQNINGTSAGTYLWNSSSTTTANQYGIWTAYVNATDAEGNEAYTSATIKVGLATKIVYEREENTSLFSLWITDSLANFNLSLIAPDTINTFTFLVNKTIGSLYAESQVDLEVKLDATEPTISIIYPQNYANLSEGTKWTWLNISTNENATCQYNASGDFTFDIDGTTFTSPNNTLHYFNYSDSTGLTDGTTYTLYYKCNDTSGNVNSGSTTHIFNISGDVVAGNTAPPAPLLSDPLSGNTTTVRTLRLLWNNATDTDGESVNYTLHINSSSGIIVETNISEIPNRTSYLLSEEEVETDIEYYWKVRAFDDEEYGAWSETWNFTIESELLVSVPTSLVEFGSLLPEETGNSSALNSPIIIENQGNILMNITITGTSIWSNYLNPTNYFKYWINANETSAYDYANETERQMQSSSSYIDIRNLNYSDNSDDARLHIYIEVPQDEPAGVKNSDITITASG